MDQTVSEPQDVNTEHFVTSRGLQFPRDRQVLSRRIISSLRSDGYELKESAAILKLLREDDRILEVGGGIGYMSTLMAANRPKAQVFSFEANPNLIPYIREVHATNNVTNASITHALLGKEDGSTTFYVRKNLLASSLDKSPEENIISEATVDVLNVNTVLEDLKPNILVCDIEGAEADLIPMMDLSGFRGALIELHPQWIGAEGVDKVFRSMMDAGLSYFARWSDSKVVCFRRGW